MLLANIQVRIRCYYHRLWLHHGLILRPNSIMHCPFVMLPPQWCPESLPCVRALSSFISSQQSKPETIMNSTKLRPFEPYSPLRKEFPKRAIWFICSLTFMIPHFKPNTRILSQRQMVMAAIIRTRLISSSYAIIIIPDGPLYHGLYVLPNSMMHCPFPPNDSWSRVSLSSVYLSCPIGQTWSHNKIEHDLGHLNHIALFGNTFRRGLYGSSAA